MLSIIINAYACSPEMGSEPGMAWNWCVALSKHCELHIITEGEFRDKIEAALPNLPDGGKNLHFYYNPLPDKVRKMCWNQGDWRFYWYYRKWQKSTLEIARQIVAEHHVDAVHQLNMIGAHGVGYLWKLKMPYVWGPFGGLGVSAPRAFMQGVAMPIILKLLLKQTLKKFTIRSGNIRQNIRRADILIAATQDNKERVEMVYNRHVECINETGLHPSDYQKAYYPAKKTFDILWVGRFIFTKRLDIALQTTAKLSDCPDIRLHIVGTGNDQQTAHYKQLAQELSLGERCIFHGQKSHAEVLDMMQQSDVFIFTSINEGTSHVVLEAIQNKLPIVCTDCCGHGNCVDKSIGIKIPLYSPIQMVQDFATHIRHLYQNRELLQQMSDNCADKQQELSWDAKAVRMVALYQEAINKHKSN